MKSLLFGLILLFASVGLLRAEDDLSALFAQARAEAPGEVQLHVIKTTGRMSDFAAKVRTVEQVPGWPQIRAKGEAAFSAWDNHKKDFAWRSEKFEVLWDIVSARELKLNSITLGGIERKIDP
ncbi:MAG: hypothetical protein C0518_15895 [Opitutus sp.]|nr:hypothetical protein [Opitutus sp.]